MAGALKTLVEEGRGWWARSPDPRNPVACATCHDDSAEVRGWAASFPKFKPMPPPHARVMTLLQATAEAVARHYRLADPLPPATAITAYLAWQGAGMPITPGVSPGQPVFAARLEQLAASVVRGARLYARRCGSCHDVATVAAAIPTFPRISGGQPEALEVFLEGHHAAQDPLPWDGQTVADVIAYLNSHIAGRPGGLAPPQVARRAKENP